LDEPKANLLIAAQWKKFATISLMKGHADIPKGFS
jgi:hypothetical protein